MRSPTRSRGYIISDQKDSQWGESLLQNIPLIGAAISPWLPKYQLTSVGSFPLSYPSYSISHEMNISMIRGPRTHLLTINQSHHMGGKTWWVSSQLPLENQAVDISESPSQSGLSAWCMGLVPKYGATESTEVSSCSPRDPRHFWAVNPPICTRNSQRSQRIKVHSEKGDMPPSHGFPHRSASMMQLLSSPHPAAMPGSQDCSFSTAAWHGDGFFFLRKMWGEFAGESTNNNFQKEKEGEIYRFLRRTVLFCIWVLLSLDLEDF